MEPAELPTVGLTLDTLAGGARYLMGPVLEGVPVKLDGRTIGHVQDGLVVITDQAAIQALHGGAPMDLSIGPVDPPADWVIRP